MICYRDMTFCTCSFRCKKAEGCPRNLTDEVIEGAKKADMGLCMADFPECFEDNGENNENS
jgi:hypothetical protein